MGLCIGVLDNVEAATERKVGFVDTGVRDDVVARVVRDTRVALGFGRRSSGFMLWTEFRKGVELSD